MIHSPEIEKRVLSGLLQNPEEWGGVCDYLVAKDFYEGGGSKVHSSIFRLLKQAFDNSEAIDEVILIQRLKDLQVSFPDNIELPEYIRSFTSFKVNPDVLVSAVKDLKKLSVRREIYDGALDLANFAKKESASKKYSEIIESSDKIYHNRLEHFESVDSGPTDLFAKMEEVIEERGNNPIEEFGMMGPHPRINDLYGSLLLAGNISVIVARSGVGKTTFAMDYSTKVAESYKVPVLHFDNGEMSEEELLFRQCAAISKVPVWLLQTGKWRTSSWGDWSPEEVVRRVRASYKAVKDLRFYYENVAGLSPDELNTLLKRIYYSKVGRGKKMIFSFDYIKSDFSSMGGNDSWLQVAYMVHKFKQTIHREIVVDGEQQVSMMTSVQANRSGITTNRASENIVEDESVVGLADMITQYCSHLFLLRRKVPEEIQQENGKFGTHKLVNLKCRHLGKEFSRAIDDVEMPDGSKKKNYINIDFNQFSITEKGDLVDYVESLNRSSIPVASEGNSDLPDLLDE